MQTRSIGMKLLFWEKWLFQKRPYKSINAIISVTNPLEKLHFFFRRKWNLTSETENRKSEFYGWLKNRDLLGRLESLGYTSEHYHLISIWYSLFEEYILGQVISHVTKWTMSETSLPTQLPVSHVLEWIF